MSGILGIGGGGDTEFYPYTLDQSVRFNDDDTAMLSKTFGSAGNSKTWTWSGWVKRGNLGDTRPFFVAGSSGSAIFQAALMTYNSVADRIQIYNYNGSYNLRFATTQLFRDVSGWYHIVLKMDTTQATSTDRFKLYINGEAVTAFEISTYPSQNFDTYVSSAASHRIGRNFDSAVSTKSLDGYLAEVNFIDGTALDPTSFGETKAGIWVPIEYTGSYGTNGFKLAFQDSASLGDDTSGNGHDFTANNLAASDQMPDSPTSNFPTMNPLWQSKGTWTTAEGNLQNTWGANNYQSGIATMGLPATGKWYWEIYLKSRTYTNWLYWNLVIADYVEGSGNNGNSAAQWSNHYFSMSAERSDTGYLVVSSGSTNSIASSGIYDTGNVIQVAFDADNKRLYLGDSGTWFLSADPGAESGDGTAVWYNWSDDAQGKLFPALNVNYLTYVDVHNFGQDSTFAGNLTSGGNADANGIGDFKYSVPSGYLALCAANLPAPGIDPAEDEAPTDYFNTVLYTGNETARSITGVGFQPDWVWIKRRSSTFAHNLYDVVRGAGNHLISSTTAVESTTTTRLTAFESDGFALGTGTALNQSSGTYAAWNWKAGGTAVSNTDGSITSSVSASPESGFSVVTYTGTGANATVGHGLGKAPDMIILKKRADDTQAWQVYHSANTSEPETEKLTFNTDAATVDDNTTWNDTAPTSTVFSIGTGSGTNENTDTYVAYCFADIDGMMKAGSYVGNGATDGAFVYTGFRPAFVLMKATSTTGDWEIIDSVRSPFNIGSTGQNKLEPNNDGAESLRVNDFISNGFKTSGSGNTNASGVTYVYLAFAEQPFKYANAR